jgi:hypothetical protein
MHELKDTLKALGVTWANEYGDYIKGAAEDVAAFYGQIAGVAATAAIEGDEDALKLIRLAGYSMLTAHRCELAKKNRATVQRGIRLLVDVVSVVAAAATGNAAGAIGAAVNRVIPKPRG